MTVFIDTLAAKKHLVKGKTFTDKQAEALLDAFKDANEQVATRSDLRELESRLKLYILTNNLAVLAILLAALKYFL